MHHLCGHIPEPAASQAPHCFGQGCAVDRHSNTSSKPYHAIKHLSQVDLVCSVRSWQKLGWPGQQRRSDSGLALQTRSAPLGKVESTSGTSSVMMAKYNWRLPNLTRQVDVLSSCWRPSLSFIVIRWSSADRQVPSRLHPQDSIHCAAQLF